MASRLGAAANPLEELHLACQKEILKFDEQFAVYESLLKSQQQMLLAIQRFQTVGEMPEHLFSWIPGNVPSQEVPVVNQSEVFGPLLQMIGKELEAIAQKIARLKEQYNAFLSA